MSRQEPTPLPAQVHTLANERVAVRPIRTDEDLEKTEEIIAELWGAKPGSPDGDRLDILMTLAWAYEREHHPIELPDPIEAIKERMQVLDWKQQDLADALEVGRGRASEVLNRKRKLTLTMVRVLSVKLGLSIECLAQEYDLAS